MGKFSRGLYSGVAEYLFEAQPRWWRDLIDFRFAKQDGSENQLLIAVRNGYLNAYVEGQSLLKVQFEAHPKVPHGRIHRKYIDEGFSGQQYLYFDGEAVREKCGRLFCAYKGVETLQAWVERARKFGKVEKQGVAAIARGNQNVIDVDMALPAESRLGEVFDGRPVAKVAPRMDIVALENGEANGARIAFYKAKLHPNPELRANSLEPQILNHLATYQKYVMRPGRRTEIIAGYRWNCRFLRLLRKARGEAANGLIERAAFDELDLDPVPRVVIFGYDASRVGEDSSWERHRAALGSTSTLIMEPKAADIRLPT